MKAQNVRRINEANPKLQAAVKQAKDTLPEFEKLLIAADPGSRFAIKGTFFTTSGQEYLWVKDPVLKDQNFTGILDQIPIAFKGSARGDPVVVRESDVVDWLVHDSTGDRGGFTEKALGK